MVGPLSVGEVYGNSPEAYPFPTPLFNQARKLNATVGFAHFYGSQPHSTLILNLVRNTIDFVELFQFGKLHAQDWYQLLNAGFRVVGECRKRFPRQPGRIRILASHFSFAWARESTRSGESRRVSLRCLGRRGSTGNSRRE